MQGLHFVLMFTALTFLSWGAYGPLLRYGTTAMGHDGLKAFVGVGLAYFVIAVIVPFWVLSKVGEKGKWTLIGTTYSIVAGSVGAIGALGIILALVFKGSPVYVMPLVFGFAPIVNTLVTAWMGKTLHNIRPIFVFGIITAALGAVGVLVFKPGPQAAKPAVEQSQEADAEADSKPESIQPDTKKLDSTKPEPSKPLAANTLKAESAADNRSTTSSSNDAPSSTESKKEPTLSTSNNVAKADGGPSKPELPGKTEAPNKPESPNKLEPKWAAKPDAEPSPAPEPKPVRTEPAKPMLAALPAQDEAPAPEPKAKPAPTVAMKTLAMPDDAAAPAPERTSPAKPTSPSSDVNTTLAEPPPVPDPMPPSFDSSAKAEAKPEAKPDTKPDTKPTAEPIADKQPAKTDAPNLPTPDSKTESKQTESKPTDSKPTEPAPEKLPDELPPPVPGLIEPTSALRRSDRTVFVAMQASKSEGDSESSHANATEADAAKGESEAHATGNSHGHAAEQKPNYLMIALSIAMAALCWGSYGPMLHQGQMRMGGSRLRPFACVGIAYFIIAVAAPLGLLYATPTISQGDWTVSGMTWSIIAGAAGALGALGIILAFNSGGKPIYVMPLVFGFAPVINTFISLTEAKAWSRVEPMFWISLGVVIAGAITVLITAPKAHHGPAPTPAKS